MRKNSRMIECDGTEIYTEAFGDHRNPGILLIMGSGASMDWWATEFCQRLASWDHYVVRYDHRDTGRSSTYQVGAPPYDFGDLVNDAIAVLESFGLERAHLVGMSMGGAIAQMLALDHPARVESLTLIASSPVDLEPAEPELPSMSPEAMAGFARAEPDWDDSEAVVEHLLALAQISASPHRRFEREEFRAHATYVVEHSRDIAASLTNHNRLATGPAPSRQLAELCLPTLVLHGRDDPVLPFEHGLALSRRIPGARLVALEQTGHELPRSSWERAVPEIIGLTASVGAKP